MAARLELSHDPAGSLLERARPAAIDDHARRLTAACASRSKSTTSTMPSMTALMMREPAGGADAQDGLSFCIEHDREEHGMPGFGSRGLTPISGTARIERSCSGIVIRFTLTFNYCNSEQHEQPKGCTQSPSCVECHDCRRSSPRWRWGASA